MQSVQKRHGNEFIHFRNGFEEYENSVNHMQRLSIVSCTSMRNCGVMYENDGSQNLEHHLTHSGPGSVCGSASPKTSSQQRTFHVPRLFCCAPRTTLLPPFPPCPAHSTQKLRVFFIALIQRYSQHLRPSFQRTFSTDIRKFPTAQPSYSTSDLNPCNTNAHKRAHS